ncbi:hypothetical protein CONPUDRAFT_145996 [Coniophora puteana RWD-64-598 SS2]|uniref:Uncharacterized protein n=1 Tax=Coniophora puteana (strain RWD-64-598) TaxID=741705 RepID=A0A5M3MFT9_CONPW|nr:uncharacterized protein CONPUDRAFT_145996 [Coniophora puteana RWD-64-598 SS2]EIW77866.1 hypothetical protein CONPUDRAFT_145996 [Coniophora puteana RWD-64-598 SS2]
MQSPWYKSIAFYLFMFFAMTALHVASTIRTLQTLDGMLPTRRQYSWVDDDYPDQLPIEMPTVALEMLDGEDHYGLHDDEEWVALFPNDGFLTLGPSNRTFFLSMIHQFHCLDVIRVGMVANRTGSIYHVEHCLRYLRQIILCNSDVTIETGRPRLVDGVWMHVADGGTGMIHRCRDWTKVRDFLVENPPMELKQTSSAYGEGSSTDREGY